MFKILYYLVEKGCATAPQLAERFEVSVRTIYRDIDALSEAGIPVYTEQGRNGGIHLLDGFVLDKMLFSEREKQQILMALQGLSSIKDNFGKETLTKVAALFQTSTEDYFEVDLSRWGMETQSNQKFDMLRDAIRQRHSVDIVILN